MAGRKEGWRRPGQAMEARTRRQSVPTVVAPSHSLPCEFAQANRGMLQHRPLPPIRPHRESIPRALVFMDLIPVPRTVAREGRGAAYRWRSNRRTAQSRPVAADGVTEESRRTYPDPLDLVELLKLLADVYRCFRCAKLDDQPRGFGWGLGGRSSGSTTECQSGQILMSAEIVSAGHLHLVARGSLRRRDLRDITSSSAGTSMACAVVGTLKSEPDINVLGRIRAVAASQQQTATLNSLARPRPSGMSDMTAGRAVPAGHAVGPGERTADRMK